MKWLCHLSVLLIWLLQRLTLLHGIKGTISSNNYYYGTAQPPNEMTCILSLLAQHTIITAIFLLQNTCIYGEYVDYIYELPWSKFKSCFQLHRSEHIASVIRQVKII